jgi:hypothetical protein
MEFGEFVSTVLVLVAATMWSNFQPRLAPIFVVNAARAGTR